MLSLGQFLDLKKYNLIQLPDTPHITTWLENRHARNVMYAQNLDNFFNNAEKLEIKDVYFWMISNNSATCYAFVDRNGVVHKAQLQGGWKTPNEATEAEKLGFTNPLEFRTAKNLGFKYKERYNQFQVSGFADKKEWLKMEKLGFENKTQFTVAEERGCKNMKEYEELEVSGFPNMEIKKEAEKYDAETLGIYILIKTIDVLPKGRPTLLESISQKFNEDKTNILDKFRTVQTGEHTSRRTVPVINFSEEMFGEKAIMKLGIYDFELSVFHKGMKNDFRKKYVVNEDKIYIDGNNVCMHSGGGPSIQNLISMKNELKGKQVEIFISDNIRKGNYGNWDDAKKLEKMISNKQITLAPPDFEDDYWWISFAFKTKGLMITNDKLDDWRMKNPEKIGEFWARRVTYSISRNDVVFGPPLGELNV